MVTLGEEAMRDWSNRILDLERRAEREMEKIEITEKSGVGYYKETSKGIEYIEPEDAYSMADALEKAYKHWLDDPTHNLSKAVDSYREFGVTEESLKEYTIWIQPGSYKRIEEEQMGVSRMSKKQMQHYGAIFMMMAAIGALGGTALIVLPVPVVAMLGMGVGWWTLALTIPFTFAWVLGILRGMDGIGERTDRASMAMAKNYHFTGMIFFMVLAFTLIAAGAITSSWSFFGVAGMASLMSVYKAFRAGSE